MQGHVRHGGHEPPHNNIVGRRMRKALDDDERSAAWLARQLGLHSSTVTSWITGRHTPPLHRLQDVSLVLKRPVTWLLGETNSR